MPGRIHRWVALILAAALLLAAASASAAPRGYTATRYPIVLVHGLLGFDTIGPLTYWHGIPSALREDGAEVFVTQVAAANATEVRGEQLLAQVEEIVAITGKARVNLIGHSHGAPTARYVAGVRPDLVASVTSVGGVNKGSPVADALAELNADDPEVGGVIARVVDGLALLIDSLSGGDLEQQSLAAMASLTTAGAAEFNRRFPAGIPEGCGDGAHVVDGVRYYSWTGTTPFTNPLDATDFALALTSHAFETPNDGLVSRCSAHLGKVIRDDYRQNHLDEVNQLFGLTAPDAADPVALYRQHANRLQRAGL
ncbi:esterase/lipase family protein [Arhodomonas sp. AD133]|uniref:esterase/lipase family protein n=1 Tax=Arhodomonas sp. AD133 TaxID=3415009 RepID=UPI003EBD0D5D